MRSREVSGGAAIAGIVRRLSAARLHRHLDRAAGVLEELRRGETHGGAHQVDEAGDEEGDAGLAAAGLVYGHALG